MRSPRNIFILTLSILVFSFLLVALGGFVHNTDSSLACPDWPFCFGQLVPKMEGAVAIEHSHRLLATLVGLLSIILVWLCKGTAFYQRAILILTLVIFQGLLGGLTVLLKINPIVSSLHLGTSQIFMALLTWQCLSVYSMMNAGQKPLFSTPYNKSINRYFNIASALLFLQILVGASIRHGGAGMACGLGPESTLLCLDPHLGHPTFWPNTLAAKFHMGHRYLAIAVALTLLFVGIQFLKSLSIVHAPPRLYRNVKVIFVSLLVFILFQIGIGLWTVYSGIAVLPVTLHLVFAMLIWMSFVALYFLQKNIFLKKGWSHR